MKPTVKIYGHGWVGKAMHELFPDAYIVGSDGACWHTHPDSFDGSIRHVENIQPDKIPTCDVAFVCVPTDLKEDDTLDCSIVADIVRDCPEQFVIIRSTLNPGTCDQLEAATGKNIIMQPEYLGETPAHPLMHEAERRFLILGGSPESRRRAIEIYMSCYNANTSIRQVTNYEAEVIKLCENRAIAFKVAQCQELYDVCQQANVDYYTVREAVYGDDPRFDLWWTFVFPDNRGFSSSKCLRKDVPAFAAWAESVGIVPQLTRWLLAYNATL